MPLACPRLHTDSPWPPRPQVVPKVEVLRRDTLKQCKEEVSIQVRGLRWEPQPLGGVCSGWLWG